MMAFARSDWQKNKSPRFGEEGRLFVCQFESGRDAPLLISEIFDKNHWGFAPNPTRCPHFIRLALRPLRRALSAQTARFAHR